MLNRLANPSSTRRRDDLAVRWRMLEAVFGNRMVLATGPIFMVCASLIGIVTGGPRWLLLWSGASVLVLIWRLRTSDAFFRRGAEDKPPAWERRFCHGAWAMASLWGICSLVICTPNNDYTRFLVITVQSGLIAGANVRNAPVPAAVNGQLYLGLGPLLLACLCSGQLRFELFCIIVLAHIGFARDISSSLYRQTERLIHAEQAMQHTNEALAATNLRLASLATTDGLTGLANRREFDEALEAACAGTGAPLACLLFDIDCFKLLNDSLGHLVGDDRLRQVATCLRAHATRPSDLVARYGGEEFAVLLRDTELSGALQVAERMRAAVEALALPHPAAPPGVVTISGGVAAGGVGGADPDSLLRAADRALYEAKSSGRNRVRHGVAPDRPARAEAGPTASVI